MVYFRGIPMEKLHAPPPTPAERLMGPIQVFIHQETSGGILLLACAVLALIWANSPWSESYVSLWQTNFTVSLGAFVLSKPILLWINDGLMAIFFFVVGLEIKREVLVGELASLKQAALPFAAALGGMIFPAFIYLVFNRGSEGASGWGIPMATDIAFALGVLALLGNRAPLALKVFLTALAIVDDLGAVLVIALFYTAEITWASLGVAAVILGLLGLANLLGVRHPLVYAVLGLGLWVAFLKSGIHATIAGVLLAMTIPSRTRLNSMEFAARSRRILHSFEQATSGQEELTELQQSALSALETACEQAETPLQRLEHALHPWVSFFIMPVFALANAGIALGGDFLSLLGHPISLGITAGLLIGKQVGITAFVWLAVRTNLAELPQGVSWGQIYGASWLAGIGFTMSLFIAGLAFGDLSALGSAKFGILTASLIAGVVGWFILRLGSSSSS